MGVGETSRVIQPAHLVFWAFQKTPPLEMSYLCPLQRGSTAIAHPLSEQAQNTSVLRGSLHINDRLLALSKKDIFLKGKIL